MKVTTSKLAYVSSKAHEGTKEFLINFGYTLFEVNHPEWVSKSVETHPDIFMCKGEFQESDGDALFHGALHNLSTKYPCEAIYNACSSGKLFLHNLKITAPALISWADSMGLEKIHVPQGYTRCNLLPIGPKSFITEDMGIWKALKEREDLDILKITGRTVLLPGHPHGFLPGAAGIIRNSKSEAGILFNGDIRKHPGSNAIKDFIEEHGLKIYYVPDKPLVDIGSIICIDHCID